MKKLTLVLASALCVLLPALSHAGAGLAVSVGSGYSLEPQARQPTSLMLAPGYSVGWLRAEVGVLGLLGDVQEGRTREWQLRPMLVVKPPLFPLYVRGILVATDVLERPVASAWGGALGLSVGLGPLSAFLEGGALARRLEGVPHSDLRKWSAEGRFGLAYGF